MGAPQLNTPRTHPKPPQTPPRKQTRHSRNQTNKRPHAHSHSRAELEERCRYLLAQADILEAEGLDVEASGVDDEVAKAKAQFEAQGLGDFNEEAYRAETLEKLRYVAVMEFLQATVKINTRTASSGGGGSSGSGSGAAAAAAAAAAV